MKGVFNFVRKAEWFSMIVAVVAGVFFVTLVAQAATTISLSLTTGGGVYASSTAAIDGKLLLGYASSTRMITANSASFGGTGTTTVSTAGDLQVGGNATTTASNGNIATGGTLAVGATANAITDMSVGFCTFASTTLAATGTSAYVDCTVGGGLSISTSDRVFVMATSSLAANFQILAASSTAATTINVRLVNDGFGTANVTTGQNSLNFWAAR
jgi:hypothetical protein